MITVYGKNTTENELQQVKLIRPENAGARWRGIRHGELLDHFHDQADDRGWKMSDMQCSLSEDKYDLVGAFNLSIANLPVPEGRSLSMGFMTSNNRKKTLRLFVGARIQICNNGMATGEVVMNKKHTTGADWKTLMTASFDAYYHGAKHVESTVVELQQTELTPEKSESILMHAGRDGIVGWPTIGKIDTEYRNPTYAEHSEKTGWGMMNAFTHIIKSVTPARQLIAMNEFRQLLANYASN